MLETPRMQQYDNRNNLLAADNQQERPEMESSTTTCTGPMYKCNDGHKRKTNRRMRDKPGYKWDNDCYAWVRIIELNKAMCSKCKEWKTLDNFASIKGKPYSLCKACQKLSKAVSRYKITRQEAERLYNLTCCQCCGRKFKNPQHKHLHHIPGKLVTCVCLTCNHLLRDESKEHMRRLNCILQFVINRDKI